MLRKVIDEHNTLRLYLVASKNIPSGVELRWDYQRGFKKTFSGDTRLVIRLVVLNFPNGSMNELTRNTAN